MDNLWETLTEFVIDYNEYLPDSIPELKRLPTSNQFLSDYVLTNLPFVIRPIYPEERFKAVNLWHQQDYIRFLMRDETVTVAITPDGHADSIVDDLFMVPEERTMPFDDFYQQFLYPDPHQIHYLQKQNNNLIEEFSPLVQDVGPGVSWATEAFASPPDAANIWMGNHQSVTSVHKDHYENIYSVITGHKTFNLYPPVAMSWMPYKKCKKFQWEYVPGVIPKWNKKDLNEEVEWIIPTHQPQTPEQFTLFHNTKSYVVDVFPGDLLYIPALWFHEVHQSTHCIAVNYWYDMKFDMKYPFFKLLAKLCKLTHNRRDASTDVQTELEHMLLFDLHAKQKEFVKEEVNKKTTFHKHVKKQ